MPHSIATRMAPWPQFAATQAGQSKAVSSTSPEDFARYFKAESDKFHPVIKAAGLEGSQ